MKTIRQTGLALLTVGLLGCNQAHPGQNTTDSGTQLSEETVNSTMENNRTAADVDTVVSPGSNALDQKSGDAGRAATDPRSTETKTGTGTDPNMQGQSDTHGRDTRAGNK